MGIIKKVEKRLKRKDPQKVAEEIAKTYKQKKENGEEHPIDGTVEKLMEIIKENSKPEETKEILKAVTKQEEIPDRIYAKTFTRISKTDEIPDKVITQVVEDANTKIPDEVIRTIIEEGDIEIKQRLRLLRNVDNKKIIEERIINEFKILYKLCKSKRDDEIVERIEELKEILTESKSDIEIRSYINQIVARKMAENFYSDISKGTKIYTFAKVIPIEEMLKADLPSIVQEEFEKIEENDGKKENRYDKSRFKIQILREMARDIAYRYKETEIFVIPQSDSIKALQENEEEIFIKTIENSSGKKLSEEEIADIKGQIKGRVNNTQIKELKLISEIKRMPDKNRSIDFLIKLLEDKQTLETLSMLEENGVIETLNLIPQEKRVKTIKSIGEVLEKRKYKVATITPKIKEKQDIKIHKKKEER